MRASLSSLSSTSWVALGLALALASCSSASEPTSTASTKKPTAKGAAAATELFSHHGTVQIDAGGSTLSFAVELALTDAERSHGLMFREHLGDDDGMLFLFPTQHPLSFWMKNTRLPLDMVFIDESGVIAGIVENAEPLTTTSRRIDKPSRYVLELNAGTCARRGIAAGQRVRFDGIPADVLGALVDARALEPLPTHPPSASP